MGVALVYFQGDDLEAAAPFKNFIDSANKLMFVIVEFVIDLTPFAVLSLIANAVSAYGVAEPVPYTAAQYVFLVVLTLVVSIGTVGVPGTSTELEFADTDQTNKGGKLKDW